MPRGSTTKLSKSFNCSHFQFCGQDGGFAVIRKIDHHYVGPHLRSTTSSFSLSVLSCSFCCTTQHTWLWSIVFRELCTEFSVFEYSVQNLIDLGKRPWPVIKATAWHFCKNPMCSLVLHRVMVELFLSHKRKKMFGTDFKNEILICALNIAVQIRRPLAIIAYLLQTELKQIPLTWKW